MDTDRPLWRAHAAMSEECAERMVAESGILTAVAMEVKSSAYEIVMGAVEGKSETERLKRAGEITEPWGTPDLLVGRGRGDNYIGIWLICL